MKREGGVIGDDGDKLVPEWVTVHQAVEDPWGSEFGAIGNRGAGLWGYCFCEAAMEYDDLAVVECHHYYWLEDEDEGGWLDWLDWCVYYPFEFFRNQYGVPDEVFSVIE